MTCPLIHPSDNSWANGSKVFHIFCFVHQVFSSNMIDSSSFIDKISRNLNDNCNFTKQFAKLIGKIQFPVVHGSVRINGVHIVLAKMEKIAHHFFKRCAKKIDKPFMFTN
jgi:hypothetical protein